jgi:hypothetical protein
LTSKPAYVIYITYLFEAGKSGLVRATMPFLGAFPSEAPCLVVIEIGFVFVARADLHVTNMRGCIGEKGPVAAFGSGMASDCVYMIGHKERCASQGMHSDIALVRFWFQGFLKGVSCDHY